VSAPVLKRQRGGCFSSWCQTGWYASPAVADLDNDGQAEAIFATWTQKGSHAAGQLIIASSTGAQLHAVSLPRSSAGWDGALAAPTLANIDGDADREMVIGTAHMGVVAYDLPDTAGARVLWGTGRGSYLRSGTPVVCLTPPSSSATPLPPAGPFSIFMPLVSRGC